MAPTYKEHLLPPVAPVPSAPPAEPYERSIRPSRSCLCLGVEKGKNRGYLSRMNTLSLTV